MIVGTGPLEAELRRQASHLRIPTIFAGFVNQSHLPEIYAAVELLVLPSDNESWGMVVNEAFACGLPAIVSDRVGCAPDMIREGLTGCVFPMGDSQRLADTIRKFAGMVRDHAVIQALAEVSERYSPRRSAEAIVGAAEICLKEQKLTRDEKLNVDDRCESAICIGAEWVGLFASRRPDGGGDRDYRGGGSRGQYRAGAHVCERDRVGRRRKTNMASGRAADFVRRILLAVVAD